MMPRSAIFVRGDDAALEVMKNFAVTELQMTRVLTPDIEQTVDASSDAQVPLISFLGSFFFNYLRRCILRG
jgi:hypothetical protein